MSETIDVNSVKAGPYELVSVQWDQRTSEPGEPLRFTRHRQGDVVQLDEAEARRLLLSGAVVEPGSRERAQAQALAAQLATVLASLPEDQAAALREQFSGESTGADPAGGSGGGSAPERPAKAADKGAWVAYIVALGLKSEDEATRLTRDQLQELAPEA